MTSSRRNKAYQYIPSQDRWENMKDYTLRTSSYDSGCAIITERTNGRRRLVNTNSRCYM